MISTRKSLVHLYKVARASMQQPRVGSVATSGHHYRCSIANAKQSAYKTQSVQESERESACSQRGAAHQGGKKSVAKRLSRKGGEESRGWGDRTMNSVKAAASVAWQRRALSSPLFQIRFSTVYIQCVYHVACCCCVGSVAPTRTFTWTCVPTLRKLAAVLIVKLPGGRSVG